MVSAGGLEPPRLPIRPSNVRVCQFRHADIEIKAASIYHNAPILRRQHVKQWALCTNLANEDSSATSPYEPNDTKKSRHLPRGRERKFTPESRKANTTEKDAPITTGQSRMASSP
jgi:hypothetical protein